MSKRHKPGDWVWLPPNAGFVGMSHKLRVEIQPEEHPDNIEPCFLCKDTECRCWATVLSEPDPERKEHERHMLCHVSECQMFDEPQNPADYVEVEQTHEPKYPVKPITITLTDPSKRHLAIRRILMPRDTNPRGEIFGGAILAEIDLAGAVEARRQTKHDVATRFMNGIEFKHPVTVGDVVTLYTTLVKIGTTSITVKVEVDYSRDGTEAPVAVVATEVMYVTIKRNEDGTISKVPVKG